jgi:hypothetical protein
LKSILAVPVFLVYIIGFVFMQPVLFKLPKASDIEIVKIIKGERPDTWKVVMNFESGGEKGEAALDIQEGKAVSGKLYGCFKGDRCIAGLEEEELA